MYGTVARMKIKPGTEQQFMEMEDDTNEIPGFVFSHVYRLDSGGDEYILVVGFKDKDAYVANANSPAQHERFLRYRELMAAEPEWHDGEIVQSMSA